jgi:hypothetical protein
MEPAVYAATEAASIRMLHKMRLFLLLLIVALPTFAQNKPLDDFSITLERTGSLGSCPDYQVTIDGHGSMLYEGRYSVRAEGVRRATISPQAVQKLIQRLRHQSFFIGRRRKKFASIFQRLISRSP